MSRRDDRDALVGLAGVLLGLAVVVADLRMERRWAEGVHLLVTAVPAALLLGAGLRARRAGDRPPAIASVLLLAGLAVFALADYRLGQLLVEGGGPFGRPRALTLFFALLAAAALAAAARTRSAACLLAGALAAGGTILAAVRWIFDTEDFTSYRPVLLVLALAFAAAAYALRERHRVVMVAAAGLAILAIVWTDTGLFVLGAGEMPDAWEAVALLAALALAAFVFHTRAPGPGVIAILILAGFVVSLTASVPASEVIDGGVEDPSLVGWPIALVVGGLAALAFGILHRRRDGG